MSSITMAADSTQSEYSRKMLKMNEKSVKKRRKRYSTPSRSSSSASSSSDDDAGSESSSDSSSTSSSYEKRKKDFKKKSSKSSRNSKRTSSASESDSDLDLKKPLLPIVGYMEDKKTMVDNMFKSISSKKLKTMLPEILKSMSLTELKSLCSEQLEVMSNNRISKILQGTDPSEISSTESEDDGLEGNTSVVNESQQSTGDPISQQLPQSKPQNQQNNQQQIKSSSDAIDEAQPVQSHQNLLDTNTDIKTDETTGKSTTTMSSNNTTTSLTAKLTISNNSSNISKTSHDLNALDEDELDYDEEEEVVVDTKSLTTNLLKQQQNYEFNNSVAELFVDTVNDDFNDEDDKDDAEEMKGSKDGCENDVKIDKPAEVDKVSDSVPVRPDEKMPIKLVRNKTIIADKNTTSQVKSTTKSSSLAKTSLSDQSIQQSPKVAVTKVSPSTSTLPSAKTEHGNKNNNDKGLDKTQLEILELEMRARAIKAMLKAQEELEQQMQQKSNKQQNRRSVEKQQQHIKRKDVEMGERNSKKRDGDVKERSSSRLHYDDNEVKYTRKVCRLPTPEVMDVPVKRLMMRRVSSPPTHRRYQDDDMRTLSYDVHEYDRRRSDYIDHYHDDYDHEEYHESRYRQHHHQDCDYHHYPQNFRRPRVVYMPSHDDRRILSRYENFEDGDDYDYQDDYRSRDRSRSYRGKSDYLVIRRSRDDDDQYDDRRLIRK